MSFYSTFKLKDEFQHDAQAQMANKTPMTDINVDFEKIVASQHGRHITTRQLLNACMTAAIRADRERVRNELSKIGRTTYHIKSFTGDNAVFHLSSDVDYQMEDLAVVVNGERIQESGKVDITISDGAIVINTEKR